MADFKQALNLMLQNEGGYVNDPEDRGGETYKGIARNMNGGWLGWGIIDEAKRTSNFPANLANNSQLNAEIEEFYEKNYWTPMAGNAINDQRVANAIFDFGVNAGVKTSVLLAQKTASADEDGNMGPKSLESINGMHSEQFLAVFTLMKIARYVSIVRRRPANQKYFYGWVRRALGDI